jgi:hypothetical protein
MRNVGVFTSHRVQTAELVEFVSSYSARIGQPFSKRSGETVVGHSPDVLYVFDGTAATDGYFGEDERGLIASRLGAAPQSYINIHFASTDTAFKLADAMAQEVRRKWDGIIDYGGTGGQLGVPPETVRQSDGSQHS